MKAPGLFLLLLVSFLALVGLADEREEGDEQEEKEPRRFHEDRRTYFTTRRPRPHEPGRTT